MVLSFCGTMVESNFYDSFIQFRGKKYGFGDLRGKIMQTK